MFRSSAATPTARRLLGASALLTAAVSLAACGGSATKSLSAPSAKPVATESSAPESSVAPTSDAPTDAVPNEAVASPADSAPATTPTSAAAAGGGSDPGSPFCTFAKNEEAQSQKFSTDLATATPDAVKAYIVQTMKALGEFEKAAPSAIQSEVKVVVSLDQKLFSALADNGYSFAKAAPSISAAAMDPAFTAAVAKLGTYLMSTCGISATG